MSDIKSADFLATFPTALKKDNSMLALGKLIAEELHITANEAKKNIIYANIDTLSETWLDVLAYDLHVDWYDFDYPIEAKRAIIKDSVRVHQKLGTKSAVEMALSGIHPKSEIEEWFTYEGKPFRFRIVLDTTHSRVEADYEEIVKTVDKYKRLTAHLDGLYYQCSMNIAIIPKTEYFLFSASMIGKSKTGIAPYRNIVGAVENTIVEINTKGIGHFIEAMRTGTKPDRNIVFSSCNNYIVTDSDTKGYLFESNQTGEVVTGKTPYINVIGEIEHKDVVAITTGQEHKFSSYLTGTKPNRNILFESKEVEVVEKIELDNFVFESSLTGTQPSRSTEVEISNKGMITTAEIESYQYTVKYCGINRLGK